MKAGAVSGGQTSSRESWLSAPLNDPNAALWASITPPANPDLATIVRRRAAAFSLDLLAQRLYLRFPAHFSSRSTARVAILAATVAFGAALGTAGYLGVIGPQQSAAAAAVAGGPAPVPSALPAAANGALAANDTPAPNAPARLAQTEVAAPPPATTLATSARSDATEQLAQPLLRTDGAAPRADAVAPGTAPANAKRGVTKKKRNVAAARRTSKRRVRATGD